MDGMTVHAYRTEMGGVYWFEPDKSAEVPTALYDGRVQASPRPVEPCFVSVTGVRYWQYPPRVVYARGSKAQSALSIEHAGELPTISALQVAKYTRALSINPDDALLAVAEQPMSDELKYVLSGRDHESYWMIGSNGSKLRLSERPKLNRLGWLDYPRMPGNSMQFGFDKLFNYASGELLLQPTPR